MNIGHIRRIVTLHAFAAGIAATTVVLWGLGLSLWAAFDHPDLISLVVCFVGVLFILFVVIVVVLGASVGGLRRGVVTGHTVAGELFLVLAFVALGVAFAAAIPGDLIAVAIPLLVAASGAVVLVSLAARPVGCADR